MRRKYLTITIFSCLTWLAVGCGDSSSTPTSDGGNADMAVSDSTVGDSATGDTVALMVTVSGKVENLDDSGGQSTIAGATVSEVGNPSNSTTSDSAGNYSIVVPGGQPVFLKAEKTGFMSGITGLIPETAGRTGFDIGILPPALAESFITGVGATRDPAKGILAVDFDFGIGDPTGGETATVTGVNFEGGIVTDASENPMMGTALVANGGRTMIFYNTDPGSATVVPSTPNQGQACSLDDGISVYPIQADAITIVEGTCATQTP